jgi:16S rRNA (uracil1498-N3)-methyltransferase
MSASEKREWDEMTRRRWIADSYDDNAARLSGAQAAHLARVLRAQAGMQFDIVAGDRVRRGTIVELTDSTIVFALHEEIDADPALPIALLLAVFKFDRMEWAIEKATELGVERIVPVIARRTEKHLAQAAAARVERWRRIAREAAQQSRRSNTVEISNPAQIKDAIREEPEATRLLLAETERTIMLRDALSGPHESAAEGMNGETSLARIRLAIGPEGGWTPEEETLFAKEGWKPASLGPRILRAETAAIAAVSIVAAWLD